MFDELIRQWQHKYPGGQVAALGEGLETQFHRVDDGRVRWLSVDLPETIAIRDKLLPDSDRHRNLTCSAFDLRWMDQVDPHGGIFVTAAGLLMYFQPTEVHGLIASIAERFPAAEIAFDVVAPWVVRKTRRGWRKTSHYTTPTMLWGLRGNDLGSLYAWHPNIAEIRAAPFCGGRESDGPVFRPVGPSKRGWDDRASSFVHLRCRPNREGSVAYLDPFAVESPLPIE